MNKLPKLYKNTNITKSINKDKCIVNEKDISLLDEIFNGLANPYNINLEIKTKDKVLDTYIVKKTNNYITTISNEKIPIDEIIHIKKKDK